MVNNLEAQTEPIDLSGRVILVTGANSGVGKATSIRLARMGAVLVMMARDPRRGEEALSEVKSASDNPHVHLMLCELASFADISRFVEQFSRRFERLDVLVNNAGIYLLRRRMSTDGLEKMLAVNHLAPFLLTNLLLDMLKKSAPARIVTVSSASHRIGRIALDDLQRQHRFRPNQVYGETKLMNILFTYELARRLEGSGVTANALHPGFVRTNLAQRENGWLVRLLAPLAFIFGASPEEGAETPVYLATSPEVQEVTGRYFVKKRAVRSAPITYDEEFQRQLWTISHRLVQGWLE